MDHLDELSLEELQEALDNVENKKSVKRLLAAIAYKNGVTQTELAEWYDVERRTIYSWLKRLDTADSLEHAVTDEERSGRQRKLSTDEQDQFEQTLSEPPTAIGYEVSTWTPALVQQYLEETFDVEYSLPSCRRLLKEAGFRHQKSPSITAEVDVEDRETLLEELQKSSGGWTR